MIAGRLLCDHIDLYKEFSVECSKGKDILSECINSKINEALNIKPLLDGYIGDKEIYKGVDIEPYNSAHVEKLSELNLTALYLNDFQGDSHPRALEIWVADTDAVERGHNIHSILEYAKKISDRFDNIYKYGEDYFIVKLDASGHWQFGGSFLETKINSVSVYKINKSKELSLQCLKNI